LKNPPKALFVNGIDVLKIFVLKISLRPTFYPVFSGKKVGRRLFELWFLPSPFVKGEAGRGSSFCFKSLKKCLKFEFAASSASVGLARQANYFFVSPKKRDFGLQISELGV